MQGIKTMDMRIEAAPMAAEVEAVEPVVLAIIVTAINQAFVLIERVASFSCPSIAGTSISAVAPDLNFEGGTALAAA